MSPKKNKHSQNSNRGASNPPPQARGGRGSQRGRGAGRGAVGRGGHPTQESIPRIRWMEHDVEDIWQALSGPSPAPPSPVHRGRGRGGRGGFGHFHEVNNRGGFRGRGNGPPTPSHSPAQHSSGGRGGPHYPEGGRDSPLNRGRGRGARIGATPPQPPSIPDPRRFGPGGNRYLKPIQFVKSSTILFEEHEEIFMPEIADDGPLDPEDIPETQKIEQIFHRAEDQNDTSGSEMSIGESDLDHDGGDDGPHLLPIEPKEVAHQVLSPMLQDLALEDNGTPIVAISTELTVIITTPKGVSLTFAQEDQVHTESNEYQPRNQEHTVDAQDIKGVPDPMEEAPSTIGLEPSTELMAQSTSTDIQEVESSSLFVLDAEGARSNNCKEAVSYSSVIGELQPTHEGDHALGLAEDDVVLVPIKPSRRAPQTQATPAIVPSASASNDQATATSSKTPKLSYQRQVDPRTPHRKLVKTRRSLRRKKDLSDHVGLGWQRGAPRIGDSDLEWGSDGPPGALNEANAQSEGDVHGSMDIDPELIGVNMAGVIQGFATALGSNQMTIQDMEIEELIAEEDREKDEPHSSSSADEEMGGSVQEDKIGSSDDDDDDDDDDEGGELAFKRKLSQMRQKGKKPATFEPAEDYDVGDGDDSDDPVLLEEMMWEDQNTDDIIAEIEDILEQHADVLAGRDRKKKRALFKTINEGYFGDFDFPTEPRKKGKKRSPHIPSELHEQWEKDRQKKAERKRLRQEARLAAMSQGRKGKKVSNLATKGGQQARPVNDIFKLEKAIRALLADLGRTTLTLPPMEKESRRRVHLLADCFHLKSESKGKGEGRYPVLIKTSKSGININEEKVTHILRAVEETGAGSSEGLFWKAFYKHQPAGKRSKGSKMNREGEIVGQHAAHIDESNIGYQLLQSMGWRQGDRIGVTGGLAAPLTAVIKRSKLGLGAS